jgi:hypothetical protein
VSADAQEALAVAWIAAQDDLDDVARIDAVRVAADRLQAHGHPLGELVMLGLTLLDCREPDTRARLRDAYEDCVASLLAEALGPFASLMTHPRAFDMRWSLCYLEAARLPLHTAHRYAGLLGYEQLDPPGMLALFLAQPAARCLRSLTLDLGQCEASYPAVLELIACSHAPIETLEISRTGFEPPTREAELLAARPHLHTLSINGSLLALPGGDPQVRWTGDPDSIRALGRAATDPNSSEHARARIRRMGRNSARYLTAIRATEPFEDRRARLDAADLRRYASDASSLDWQQARFEEEGVTPRWTLRARWRELVPNGSWFGTQRLEELLREHGRLHDSPRLEPLTIEAMREDPVWAEFRRQAEEIAALVGG